MCNKVGRRSKNSSLTRETTNSQRTWRRSCLIRKKQMSSRCKMTRVTAGGESGFNPIVVFTNGRKAFPDEPLLLAGNLT